MVRYEDCQTFIQLLDQLRLCGKQKYRKPWMYAFDLAYISAFAEVLKQRGIIDTGQLYVIHERVLYLVPDSILEANEEGRKERDRRIIL